jgi:hypothetical protein
MCVSGMVLIVIVATMGSDGGYSDGGLGEGLPLSEDARWYRFADDAG